MVFAVNPTAEKSFDAFQANAKAAASNSTNSTSTSSTGGASSSGSSASPTGSSPTTSPSATGTNNGAVSARAGGALLLSGVGLVAGLLL